MTQMPSNYVDFASYLHRDNQDPQWASQEEKTAMLCGFRKERFCMGFDVRQSVYEFLEPYFRSRASIEKSGLKSVFQAIRENVIKTNEGMALLLIGYYHMRDKSEFGRYLSDYTTQSRQVIYLTVDSVSKSIMEEFFIDEKEKVALCKATPNYEVYVNAVN